MKEKKIAEFHLPGIGTQAAALHNTEFWHGWSLGICFETCKEKMLYSISALHLTIVCSRASLLNLWVLQARLSFHTKHSPCPSPPFTLIKTPIRVNVLASDLWTIAAHVLKLSLTTEKKVKRGTAVRECLGTSTVYGYSPLKSDIVNYSTSPECITH